MGLDVLLTCSSGCVSFEDQLAPPPLYKFRSFRFLVDGQKIYNKSSSGCCSMFPPALGSSEKHFFFFFNSPFARLASSVPVD